MKKVLIILFAALFMIGCSEDNASDEVTEVSAEENAREEAYDQSEEAEKEIYLNTINNLISDYDETYETFTTESGTSFYNMVITDIDSNGLDTAKENTEQLLPALEEDEQEVFGEFLDELLEIEETFSHLDWSD